MAPVNISFFPFFEKSVNNPANLASTCMKPLKECVMKRSILLTAGLAFVLAGIPREAEAGSSERAFVAGVIGGAVLASAVHDTNYTVRTNAVFGNAGSCYSGNRVVTRTTHYSRPARNYTSVSTRGGYYEVRREKVWVPGYREKVRASCGRWIVRDVPGYYEYQKRRVWVPERRVVHRPSHSRVVYVR